MRRGIRSTIGWAIGIAAYFLLVGALIASILEFFDQNRRFAELAAAAGFAGLDSANGFAAALFSLLAIPTGLYAATRLAAMVADEKARRWTPLFAAPVSRTRLAVVEIAVTTVGVVILHATAALAIWAGAAITGAPLTIGAALAGALNTAPIAWLVGRRRQPRRRLVAVSCRSHRRPAGRGWVPAQRHHPGHASARTGW